MSPHSASTGSATSTVPSAPAAVPTIQRVLHEYLEDRSGSLSPVDVRLYRHVLLFLEYCVDNRGYRNLAPADRERYERLFHESGGETQFSEIFGPELLLPELSDFAEHYLKQEVHTSDRITKKAPAVVSDLLVWLEESGRLPPSILEREAERARERRTMRRRLLSLSRLVSRQSVSVDPELAGMASSNASGDGGYVDLDYHPVSRVGAGRIGLVVYRSGLPEEIGPIRLPRGVAEQLEVGWCLRSALARVRGRWHVVDLDEIYPGSRIPHRENSEAVPRQKGREGLRGLRGLKGLKGKSRHEPLRRPGSRVRP